MCQFIEGERVGEEVVKSDREKKRRKRKRKRYFGARPTEEDLRLQNQKTTSTAFENKPEKIY